jgi:hypothetical protein
MKRESFSIWAFKPGDIITRLEKARKTDKTYNSNLGIEVETTRYEDGSYRGDALIFLGVVNNCVAVKHLEDGYISNLELEEWETGWGKWTDPKTLDIFSTPEAREGR